VALGRDGLGAGLLAEDVVGHLVAPVGIDALGGVGSELGKRVARQLADPRRRHVEHVRQRVVGASALEDELDDRALVGWELIECGHWEAKG
jgi:hypothetical protein